MLRYAVGEVSAKLGGWRTIIGRRTADVCSRRDGVGLLMSADKTEFGRAEAYPGNGLEDLEEEVREICEIVKRGNGDGEREVEESLEGL